jgi:hypothetical protein
MKNALAVKTVRAHGVLAIDDLYTAITAICGAVYRNCSLCDDESQFHPQGQCGYHYTGAGWKVLADQTLSYFNAALVDLQAPALLHVAATDGMSNGSADGADVAWHTRGKNAGVGHHIPEKMSSIGPLKRAQGGLRVVASLWWRCSALNGWRQVILKNRQN